MKKVLIVDDDITSVELHQILLSKICHNAIIITCFSARDALTIIEENTDLSLLITDFAMPEMTGEYLAHRAKKQNIKTLLISSNDYTKLNDYFDAKILKPIHKDEFNQTIINLLNLEL